MSDACTRAADTLKRGRGERGEDYYRQRAQDASDHDGSAMDCAAIYYAVIFNAI